MPITDSVNGARATQDVVAQQVQDKSSSQDEVRLQRAETRNRVIWSLLTCPGPKAPSRAT